MVATPKTAVKTGVSPRDARTLLLVAALCVIACNLIFFYTQLSEPLSGNTDFKIFYTGARVFRTSPGDRLYDYDLYVPIQHAMFPGILGPGDARPYTHPPFELLVFLPLLAFSYVHAYWAWLIVSIILAIASAALLARELAPLTDFWGPLPYAIVVCLFPFVMVLYEGQDSALALIVLVMSWVAFRSRRDAQAGVWLGLGLMKFQIFIPLALILAFWKPKLLKGFGLTAVVVGTISAVMVHAGGLISYARYMLEMAQDSSAQYSTRYALDPRSTAGLRGLLYGIVSGGAASVPYPRSTILAGLSLLAVTMVFAWAIYRMRAVRSYSDETTDLAFAFAVTVSLLLSFHLLLHDLTLLAVPFALVLNGLIARKARMGASESAMIWLTAVFYFTPLFIFLMRQPSVYLLGVVTLIYAALVSAKLTQAGRALS